MLRVADENPSSRVMTDTTDPEINEHELIARIRRGETELFRELVDANKNRVFSMIMRQTGNESLAEELAQDTFIKAFRGLQTFRGQAKFSTWITRIALNTTHSYYQSRRYKQSIQDVPFDLKKHEFGGEMESEHEKEMRFAKFRDCLSKLGQKFRETVVLSVLERKSYEEVAGIVGIPVGTVRSRLHKARALLRDCVLATSEVEESV